MSFLDRIRRAQKPVRLGGGGPIPSHPSVDLDLGKPPVVTPFGPGHTTDRSDPRLGHGVDEAPVEQHDVYLVLSDEERARGFVRPVRRSYLHVGPPGPKYPLRRLTDEELANYDDVGYVMYEEYPDASTALGRFWTRAQLAAVGCGCGAVTTMSLPIAETYAREPGFYGSTYCCTCRRHLPVGRDGEFVWDDGSGQRVGT